MTFVEAAEEVLRLMGQPLHYKEITAVAIEKSLLSHVGKSPEVTMGARLAALFKKPPSENPLVRIRPGVFALQEWEASGALKQMLAKAKAPAKSKATKETKATKSTRSSRAKTAATETEAPKADDKKTRGTEAKSTGSKSKTRAVAAPPVEPPPEEAPPVESPTVDASPPAEPPPAEVKEDAPVAEEQAEPSEPATPVASPPVARSPVHAGAPIAATEEDDDDQTTRAPTDTITSERDGSRRRRRRRRRPKGSHDVGNGAAYSASPMDGASSLSDSRPLPATSGPNPVVLDVTHASIDQIPLDDFAGRDMADAIALLLAAFDRGAGAVSLRQIAEAAQRRVRLAGDLQQLQSHIAASVRADNLRRIDVGLRPRFRFTGGRIALTDWLLTGELARFEQEAHDAVDRYREIVQKAFVRKLQELPGPAFVELVLLVLERIGFRHVRAIRRAGVPGQEAHFAAIHATGASDIPTALVIRKDGREVGRERVTELRGALHHYGPALVGWIITGGLVLSGAREEAVATPSSGIVLMDGGGIARLCEKHDVAVVRTTFPVAIPDLDILEALRSS